MSEVRQIERRLGFVPSLASAGAIVVCLFGQLGAIGLVGPDEPRYAWIARAMAQTGDWVTPRLYGQPWFEKPILYYWAAAVGFLLHLPSEWAARLPSACAALAAAVAIGWLARKHYGGDAISLSSPWILAPLLFSTSVAAVGFARAATPDMLFSASITWAMVSAACVLRCGGALRAADAVPSGRKSDSWSLAFFGASLGLAVLAKGPAGVVLAGGSVGLWALASKQWRKALRLAHAIAIASFCVVALPWYVACEIRNPDFLRVFLWQQNFERYLTPVFQHRQPFWFFGPIILLALVPWTAFLWPATQEGLRLWREKTWSNSSGLFFACWTVFPMVFFSFSKSKLPGYVLPAIPPLALLCSQGAIRADTRSRRSSAALGWSLAVTWALIAGAGLFAIRRLFGGHEGANDVSSHFAVMPVSTLAGAAMAVLIMAAAAFYNRLTIAISVCALCLAANVEIANLRLLPILDSFFSARPHAELMRNDLHPERIFTYRLRREWNYGLAFYFRRELPEWSANDPRPALVLTTPDGLAQIKLLGRFRGTLDETQTGLVYVPIEPAPATR
ncbi:MAG TPA: phospholipid carrier-dependent glycosyltransferase [Candidatus Acidoferrales bacterium]|nr:phospholipid carrier-dependent glycosyltransferase [Candidatus Acidoferrales bacterium]